MGVMSTRNRSPHDRPRTPVITLRRAKERRYRARAGHETFSTFDEEDHSGTHSEAFGVLQILNEDRLGPGASVSLTLDRDCEIITYVVDGTFTDGSSAKSPRQLRAGEIQLATAGRGKSVKATNSSSTEGAHLFHFGLCPAEGVLPEHDETKRFWAADRSGVLCLVASPDGRDGSLRILQDVRVYSSVLQYGQHVIHEIIDGRSVWAHVVRGDVAVDDMILTGGDGIGVESARSLSMTARETSEVIFLDLCPTPPGCVKLEGA